MADRLGYPFSVIVELTRPAPVADIDDLVALLKDTVDSGGSVSFMAPLDTGQARRWWEQTITASDPRAVFLVARDRQGIFGSVQLHPAWPPNQPHRADVAKLMVHRRARGQGIGRALMEAVESRARAARFTLLTLDTCRGSSAERLYRGTGWTAAGVIPNYALQPDGSPCDTVIFYKDLRV